jgi:crossover junction endodeoxyribonuclease RuvC
METTPPSPASSRDRPPLYVIGIDPGIDGAIARFDAQGALVTYPFPTLKARSGDKRTIDLAGLVSLVDQLRTPLLFGPARIVVYLESVNASPQQGVVSAFTFGRGFGQVEALLAAARLPVNLVKPDIWKRALSVPAAKEGAVARASSLLPQYAHLWRGPRGGTLDGIAEASLIAFYGMRCEGVRL